MALPPSRPIGWLVTTGGVILDVEQIMLHNGLITIVATAWSPEDGELVVEAGRQPFALYGADRQPITASFTNIGERSVAKNGGSLTITLPFRFRGDAEAELQPRRLTDTHLRDRQIPATGYRLPTHGVGRTTGPG